jgi:hypothetical protein
VRKEEEKIERFLDLVVHFVVYFWFIARFG